MKSYVTQPRPDAQPISVDDAWVIARHAFPHGELYWFSVPTSERDVFVFTIHAPLGGGLRGRSKVVVDRYGAVLAILDPLSGTPGTAFMQWMWPLHSGHVLGSGGRLAVCLSGLVSAGLFITGYIRWRQKRRIAKFHAERVARLLHSVQEAQG